MAKTPTIKRMANSLYKIIDNTVLAGNAEVKSYRRSLYVAGDGSSMTMTRPGVPPLNIVADPNAELGPSFYVIDAGCDAMDKFIEEANEDDVVKARVGRKAIEEAIITLVRKHGDGDKPKQSALEVESRSMLAALHMLIEERQATVPIENLVLVGLDELAVGKVTFRSYSRTAPLLQQKLLEALSNGSEAERQAVSELFASTVFPHYTSSPTCAEVTLCAEKSRVSELVGSEVDASLNLLRSYTHLLFPRDSRAFIGLKGAVNGNTRPCVSFTSNSFQTDLQIVGMLVPYTVTPDVLQHLVQSCAFNELSGLLKKQEADRTELERVIVTAIRWLGRSVTASDVPEQVLSLAIALERLMIPDNDSGAKADTLAQRLGFLVGEDADSRMSIYEQAKKLYRLRSDVVHDGKVQVPVAGVQALEKYACLALIKMAQHLADWKTHSDFTHWAKKQTFSVGL